MRSGLSSYCTAWVRVAYHVLYAYADREAQVLDYIQFNRKAALNSSLKHSSCSYLPQHDAVTADEAIHMYPFDLSPQCEVSQQPCSSAA